MKLLNLPGGYEICFRANLQEISETLYFMSCISELMYAAEGKLNNHHYQAFLCPPTRLRNNPMFPLVPDSTVRECKMVDNFYCQVVWLPFFDMHWQQKTTNNNANKFLTHFTESVITCTNFQIGLLSPILFLSSAHVSSTLISLQVFPSLKILFFFCQYSKISFSGFNYFHFSLSRKIDLIGFQLALAEMNRIG